MAQKIIVEGKDIHFITQLCITKGLPPPEGYNNRVKYETEFTIVANGKGNVEGKLKLLLRNPNNDITNVGIVIDADSETENAASNTWLSIKSILEKFGYQNLPKQPLSGGTIIEQTDKPKIGVWIMPNNISNGFIEDFYGSIIIENDLFWQKSVEITEGFVETGANRFKKIALQKAKIHTWLAWQENPGQPMGQSVKTNEKYLNLDSPLVDAFTNWFQQTFILMSKNA